MLRSGLAAFAILSAFVITSCGDDTTKREAIPSLGVTIEYPASWAMGAASMPYASCNTCIVIGPAAAHPYGVQLWESVHELGCELTCYLNIRALAQGPTTTVDANGRDALQQDFERQRPLGPANDDGDYTSYREILTVVPLVPIESGVPGTEVRALFIDAFYRYGDTDGEVETRKALALLLGTLVTASPP